MRVKTSASAVFIKAHTVFTDFSENQKANVLEVALSPSAGSVRQIGPLKFHKRYSFADSIIVLLACLSDYLRVALLALFHGLSSFSSSVVYKLSTSVYYSQ